MALVFADSVAHYSAAQATRKYTAASATIVTGRFPGSSALSCGGSEHARKTLPPLATYGVGFAFKTPTNTGNYIFMFGDTGVPQVSLGFLTDGRLAVYRGEFATLLGSSPAALLVNTWYFIELKVLVDPAVGTVLVRVNGATVINLAGVNTRATATSQITQALFGSFTAVTSTRIYGDIYIIDTTGAVNNNLLGDVRVEALFPTGAGNYAEFGTLVGAATQWQATADNPADDDTSYIGSAVVGQRSTFAAGNLTPTSGVVAGVVINHTSRKDDAGARTVAGMARLAAVDAAGAGVPVGNSYVIYQEIMETDPSAAAWTIANVNAAEFGVKEIA